MTSTTLEDDARLRRQVQELIDRNELTDLVSRLDLWLDEQRFDEARSVFTEDAAVDTPGGTVQGVDRLVGQARRSHPADQQTQHRTTNVLIDLDGDRAALRTSRIVTFAPRAELPEPHLTLGERCRLEAVRTPRGWRISRLGGDVVWKLGSLDRDAPPA